MEHAGHTVSELRAARDEGLVPLAGLPVGGLVLCFLATDARLGICPLPAARNVVVLFLRRSVEALDRRRLCCHNHRAEWVDMALAHWASSLALSFRGGIGTASPRHRLPWAYHEPGCKAPLGVSMVPPLVVCVHTYQIGVANE